MSAAFLKSEIPGHDVKRGKVRDVYDFGDRLLFIATDRISAFDWVLPTGIPDKGRVLCKLSEMWFNKLDFKHHMLSTNLDDIALPESVDRAPLEGRSMVVRKADVVPIECVVRGYLAGSGWKDYQREGKVCGIPLAAGLQQSSQLPEPIFTPATKAEDGAHDENISFDRMCDEIGRDLAERLRDLSIRIYQQAADFARTKGIIIADTKFEFGVSGDELLLIDEVLTPDSSRFWPQDLYEPGRSQQSFDKQFVRDWLETTDWDKNSEPPLLPDEIIAKTREKYIDAYHRLVDGRFEWALA